MHIAVLLGNTRDNSYTEKALNLILAYLAEQDGIVVDVFRPREMQLPWPGTKVPPDDVKRMQEVVKAADGVIMATPEYHGGFSSAMKFLIENLGFPSALSGKPVALLGVAAGRIGAIKSLEQLRGVCSHVGALVLPGPVSVANVRRVIDENGVCLDSAVQQRIEGVGQSLLDYIKQAVCPAITLEQMAREEGASS